MPKRRELLWLVPSGTALLALLAASFWLTSFSFGDFRPENPTVTFVLWAMSTCVVVGTIALGFLVFRNLLKLYVERRQNKLGSHLKTKLVTGVLALSIVPVAVHVYYSIALLNRNLDKWFSQPNVDILQSAQALQQETTDQFLEDLRRDSAQLASAPEAALALRSRRSSDAMFELLRQTHADYLALLPADGQGAPVEFVVGQSPALEVLQEFSPSEPGEPASGTHNGWLYSTVPLDSAAGALILARRLPPALLQHQEFMRARVRDWQQLEAERPVIWRSYAYKLALFTLFILFVAVWLAQFASKQIIRPIEALVTATGELAGGHLAYRIRTPAMDELAGLVESFNSMSQALETKTDELKKSNRDLARANAEIEERRSLIDAILESITPGVISVSRDGEILKFNESARKIALPRSISSVHSVKDLLVGVDRSAFEHMFQRARRTGISNREFEVERFGRSKHLSITVSALESGDALHGFVVVLEDTTELMRAQRSEAWQEVAQRLAHEIKNPLTPVALAAGRIDRLLDRYEKASSGVDRQDLRERLAQSTRTINREVQSLKTLVDSFSDFARFPAIRPDDVDLNAVVRDAVNVFDGRLPGVTLSVDADPGVLLARIDPEPFKRLIVNLIDNAAEVVQDCWVKEIVVSTTVRPDVDTVELTVADSGPGISPEDKERLFVPHFSTKERGSGLGLPIVRSIVQNHHGTIRVEDNRPSGSRFIIEVPAAARKTPEVQEATA